MSLFRILNEYLLGKNSRENTLFTSSSALEHIHLSINKMPKETTLLTSAKYSKVGNCVKNRYCGNP
jgi:hypothetical protein